MSIKTVVIDIDGTLLNSKKKSLKAFLLSRDTKVLEVKIVIATGRPYCGAFQRLLEELRSLINEITMSLPATVDWCRILLQVKN